MSSFMMAAKRRRINGWNAENKYYIYFICTKMTEQGEQPVWIFGARIIRNRSFS